MPDPVLSIGESGLIASEEKIKSLMNKMVNSETPGFKGSDILVRSFPLELAAAEERVQAMTPKVEGTFYNQLPGALVKTGKATDLELASKGFFVIMGPWGMGYTRDGRFKINAQGHLLSSVGNYPLIGQGGPIEVPAGSKVEVTQHGDVFADTVLIDRIRVVEFAESDRNALESLNGSIFKSGSEDVNANDLSSPRVIQGYIEASNVSIIEEMRDMIVMQRYATGNTEIIKNRDSTLGRLMSIGRATQ